MSILALVTAKASLPNDFDMPLLISACREQKVNVEICLWDDPTVDWSRFSAVILRSPWDYPDRLSEFLAWCEHLGTVTEMFNPLSAVRWSLDKHYLADLAARGVPVVPSRFVEPGSSPIECLDEFLSQHPESTDLVVKPAIGCYSKGVQRFARNQRNATADHIARLLRQGAVVIQPYLPAIDDHGETNLIYFDGAYSHAIRKGALLMDDGTVNVPTSDFRAARDADAAEREIAEAALDAAGLHLHLRRPLLYARVDLIRGNDGRPQLLELEVAEPSLSLPFAEAGASRFADALARLTKTKKGF